MSRAGPYVNLDAQCVLGHVLFLTRNARQAICYSQHILAEYLLFTKYYTEMYIQCS